MAFTPFSTNVKNLENLGTDKPNADLGLTGLQLRQRFDKAVSDIKAWINDTFLTEIAGISGAQNIGITQISGMDSTNVQSALAELYSKRGEVTDGTVTVSKLSNSFALPEGKIASNAVTAGKIAGNAVSTVYTATINTTWTGSAAPYTQEVTVNGLTADDKPIVDVVPSDTYETAQAQIEAWGEIYRAVAGANKLTVYATSAPTVSIPIQIRAVRK